MVADEPTAGKEESVLFYTGLPNPTTADHVLRRLLRKVRDDGFGTTEERDGWKQVNPTGQKVIYVK